MRKKIKTVILIVMIAMVSALLVHFYSHAMIPQDLVSNMRAKYLGFSGVKGRMDLWSKHHISLQQGKHEHKPGFVETEIERIHVTSDKNKLTQSVVISKDSEFISKVQIPAEAPDLKDVGMVQWNGHKEAVRNISSVSSYTHKESPVHSERRYGISERMPDEGSDHVYPNNCSDPVCLEYLTQQDKRNFEMCTSRARVRYSQLLKLNDTDVTLPPGKCHFMNGTNRATVALVSFPGSGNTWVRGLLEQATGVCTGAIYCDRALRMNGFTGEGVQSGTVLVVKAHSVTPRWITNKKIDFDSKGRPLYSSAILLVRNPLDALVSEWNRKKVLEMKAGQNGSSHTTSTGPKFFGNDSEWNTFVTHKVVRWKTLFSWVINSTDDHPTLVVRYEDLKPNTIREVKRMLDFLQFPYKEEVVEERLEKDFNRFRRRHRGSFEHFTTKQREHVMKYVQSARTELEQKIHMTFGIEEYEQLSNSHLFL